MRKRTGRTGLSRHSLSRERMRMTEALGFQDLEHQDPGSGKPVMPQNEATEPQGQVEKYKTTARNQKAPRPQPRSDEERAEQEEAKRSSNKIRIGKSNVRSSMPALRKTNLRDAKRRTAHESDDDNEDEKTKKEK